MKLWTHPNAQDAADVVASFYTSTFGDPDHPWNWDPDDALEAANSVMEGRGLPNALESVSLTFSFNGVSRVVTHQLVRTRVGAGFGQQGGRDNDWSDFNFRMPASWDRFEGQQRNFIMEMMAQLNSMYKEAVARGIPYQDARYMLPMGTETALVGTYNLLSLKGTLQRRLCNRMHWETNHVARVMADLTVRALPWVGRTLQSVCSKGTCMSVSPMFHPADLVASPQGGGLAVYAQDSPGLKANLEGGNFDWPQGANGAKEEYQTIDRIRIQNEFRDKGAVFSLVDGETVLAKKDSNGIWRSV